MKLKIVVFLLTLLGVNAYALAAQTTIAVAANFTAAARDIVPLFEKRTGHRAKLSFGSTGKLYAQIANGAPFDLFLAADTARPIKAEAEGLAVNKSRFTYAKGRLVFWSAAPGTFTDAERYLKAGDFTRIALANPKTAPYGLAGRQVMEQLKLWNMLQPKLVRGDSIAQAFQFVATHNAQAGFVALSQVKAWHGASGSYWEIPAPYYAPIEQQAVLLKRGAENPAARAFLEFLKSAETRALIRAYGYDVD